MIINNLATFLCFLTLLVGCSVVVDVTDTDYDPTLVVNGYFTTDSVVSVRLSQSTNPLNRLPYSLRVISDAEIQLFENGLLVDHLLEDSIPGFYISQFTSIE